MHYELFSQVALAEDFPARGLVRGDVATIVDRHEASLSAESASEPGYSLEIFSASGETIDIIVVRESQIEPLTAKEILHVRQLSKVAA